MNNLRAADRHRRLARRRRGSRSAGRRPMSANGTQVCQPAPLGDAAAGRRSRSGSPRSTATLLKQVGVNLLEPRQHGGFKFGIGQGNRATIRRSGTGTDPAACRRSFAHDRRHDARPARQAARPRHPRHARPRRERRPGDHARRTEPDRAVGRNRQLPRRRRIPDPGVAGPRLGRRSNISNMASAWPSPRSSLPTAASRCASAPKSANCRTKVRSSSTASTFRR